MKSPRKIAKEYGFVESGFEKHFMMRLTECSTRSLSKGNPGYRQDAARNLTSLGSAIGDTLKTPLTDADGILACLMLGLSASNLTREAVSLIGK
jgi:hypothetical protein